MEVLLRPGLLADVEIIVEKVPNAVYVPNQSIFEKNGKPVVYVRTKQGFEARQINIAKRSESVSIISGGIQPGETIAMANPEAKPGEGKKKAEEKSSGAASALPGAMPKGGQ
jgi:cobalt-zinc-cadmium efflux system membrane fusion protein